MPQRLKRPGTLCLYMIALVEAWVIKLSKRMASVRFKEGSRAGCCDEKEIQTVLRWAEIVVCYGASRTGRKCFFRAYIAGRVLAYLNYPVQMHVGLQGLGEHQRASGHCWLTVHGQIVGEKKSPLDIYPISIGENGYGVQYWVGVPP